MMRALVADGTSPDRIAIHEVAEPVPAADEVLVEVRAFSINRGELRMLRTAPDGWRPGWDFAGILRSDVDGGPRIGSRVVGVQRGGTWAERVAVPQSWIAELPTNVSFAEAAALNFEVAPMSLADSHRFVVSEAEKWARSVRLSGAKVE